MTGFAFPRKEWDAAQIYYFYRSLRIVAVKRRKNVPGDEALPMTGARAAGTAPTVVKREAVGAKTHLVQEYATLFGECVPTSVNDFNSMFNKAVQYIHVNLLQDLSPPWLDKNFPQALPGDGVLSRYLKPCFLKWDMASAAPLFGETITRTLSHSAQTLDLTAAFIVGRPLYVCTQPWQGSVCMRMAAMSPLMEHRADQKHFMCAWCREYNSGVPTTGERPRRLIQLYLQVRLGDGAITFMRTSPLHIMLHAPLAAWGTGKDLPSPSPLLVADPERVSDKSRVHFSFNQVDSERLWLHAVSL